MNFVDYTRIVGGAHRREGEIGYRIVYQLSRIRYQLGAGLIVGVISPALIRHYIQDFIGNIATYQSTVFGTLIALLIGFMIFRKVSTLPGASSLANIIPAFMTSYGLVMACFFFLRLDYSRAQFGISFAMVVLLFMVISYLLSRYRQARFVLVTDKPLSRFRIIRGVDWLTAPDRAIATRHRDLPIVVDFQSDMIDDDWERYLAEEAIAGRLVYDRRQVIESLEGRVTINHLSENSFGHLAPDSIYAPAKRYIDIVCALVALVLLSPVLLVLAILIRLGSKGPALFRQTRMGYRGKPFTVLKFRSMRQLENPTDSAASDMTLSDDDRITHIGRLIRRTRLDELPQIVNILRGEMSWIGPRPETLRLSQWYEGELPFYRYRHIVRPGITGWAQVNQGHVTSVDDVREKLEYDFYYVKYFSLWTDILIAIKTIGVVLTGHGSK